MYIHRLNTDSHTLMLLEIDYIPSTKQYGGAH